MNKKYYKGDAKERNKKRCRERYLLKKQEYIDNNRKWRENNREKAREWYRSYYKKNRLAESERNKKRWHNNPLKSAAYNAVRLAKYKGELIPQPCIQCGKPKAEAHHEDYSKPLEIIWMCSIHHRRHHHGIS